MLTVYQQQGGTSRQCGCLCKCKGGCIPLVSELCYIKAMKSIATDARPMFFRKTEMTSASVLQLPMIEILRLHRRTHWRFFDFHFYSVPCTAVLKGSVIDRLGTNKV